MATSIGSAQSHFRSKKGKLHVIVFLSPVVFAIALFAAGASTLSAAQQPSTISGVVSDQTGASVAGAKVELVSGLVVTRSVVTDSEGRYRVEGLQPGEYTVRVTAPGFQPVERRVNVAAAGPAPWPISGSPCKRWRRTSS